MPGLLIRMAITALGLWLASAWVPGVRIEGVPTLIGAALLLGLANAFVRPLVVLLTLPITILTLGLFLWVVNAAMIALVAALLENFTVSGFGAALLGALVVAATSSFASWVVGPRGRVEILVVRR